MTTRGNATIVDKMKRKLQTSDKTANQRSSRKKKGEEGALVRLYISV